MTPDPERVDAPAVAVPSEVGVTIDDVRRCAGAGGMNLDEPTVRALFPMVLSLRSLASAVDRAMAASDGVAPSEDAVPPL